MTEHTFTDCQVLVVGAGPAGLATAITAIRNGARALVVERHAGTSIYPRATGVHLRTVELLRGWGLHREVRALDVRVRPLRSVSPTLREATPLPLGYPTDPREVLAVSPAPRATARRTTSNRCCSSTCGALGGEVRFGIELIDLRRRTAPGSPRRSATAPPAPESTVRARFLVGADGTRSAVRRALGIGVERPGQAGEFVDA